MTNKGLLFFKTSSFNEIPSKYYFNKFLSSKFSFCKEFFYLSIASLSSKTLKYFKN